MTSVEGGRIKALREARGLDIAQLAKRADVHPSYIYRLEDGEVPNVSAVIIARVAKALETSMEYLVGLTDESGRFGIHGFGRRQSLTERSDMIALRLDALPADQRETVQTMFERLLAAIEGDSTDVGVRRKRLLRFFDDLPEVEQEALLSAAEKSRWTKETGPDIIAELDARRSGQQ